MANIKPVTAGAALAATVGIVLWAFGMGTIFGLVLERVAHD